MDSVSSSISSSSSGGSLLRSRALRASDGERSRYRLGRVMSRARCAGVRTGRPEKLGAGGGLREIGGKEEYLRGDEKRVE
jgi:hypothetical protein